MVYISYAKVMTLIYYHVLVTSNKAYALHKMTDSNEDVI